MGTCGRRFRRAFSPKSSVFFKEIGLRRMAVLVGRPNKTVGAVKLRGDWGGGVSATRSRKSARFCGFAAKCARQNRHSTQVTTKLSCDVMLLAKLSNQDDENDYGNKKIKIAMVLVIIRLKPWNGAGRVLHNLVSSAFPSKNGWGPTPFLREKPWGRRCVLQIFYRPSRRWNRQCNLRFNFQDLRFINNDQAVTSISLKIYAYRVSPKRYTWLLN